MTRILAWETGSDWCSVALAESNGGGPRVVWCAECVPRRHGERLLPMARALLAEVGWTPCSLDALAVGRGPGAFTGVRLGFAAAQGLAFALDRPLVPVSSLAAIALRGVCPLRGEGGHASGGEAVAPELRWTSAETMAAADGADAPEKVRAETLGRWASDARRVVVVRDARMGEVYSAAYALMVSTVVDDDVVSVSEATQDRPSDADAMTRPHTVTRLVEWLPERIETPASAMERLAGAWRDGNDLWMTDLLADERADDGAAHLLLPGTVAGLTAARAPNRADVWPHAREVARLALARPLAEGGVEAWRAEPVYLRDRVAETRAERAAAANARAAGHALGGAQRGG